MQPLSGEAAFFLGGLSQGETARVIQEGDRKQGACLVNPQELRSEILRKRDSLSCSIQRDHARRVLEHIVSLEQFVEARTILLYVDFRSELGTRTLLERVLGSGKRLLLPVTLVKERDLLAVSISDPASELAPGYCSIPEPRTEIRSRQTVAPIEIDLIFLPGSVFDERGGRMGYGGGFYDRFVSNRAPQAYRIGLAHELQMVPKAPLEEHDEVLDFIITEERIIEGRRPAREGYDA